MKKRRTKKQKLEAKHDFTLTWNSTKSEPTRHTVNRQNKDLKEVAGSYLKVSKNAQSLAKDGDLSLLRSGVIKCLSLASFILCLELVIYLARDHIFRF